MIFFAKIFNNKIKIMAYSAVSIILLMIAVLSIIPENFSAPGPYENTGTNTAEWLFVLHLKSVRV